MNLLDSYLGERGFLEPKVDELLAKFSKAESECEHTILKRLINKEYDLGLRGPKWQKIKEYEKYLDGLKRENTAKLHNNKYGFITINPRDKVLLKDFISKVENFVSRAIFGEYIYVFEQRGSSEYEAGKGFHAHILISRNLNYKPCKIKELSKNTFKKECDVNNPALFNFQYIGEEFAKDKQDYLIGVKTGVSADGEKKTVHQDIDIIWRKKNDIKEFYGNKIFV